MEPLKQWICDVCGKVIESPSEGYVVWGENEDGMVDKFRIIHQNRHIDGKIVGCDCDRKYNLSMPLESFLGDEGKVQFLSIVDPGPEFTSEYRDQIANKRLFLEVVRRLQIPYYEEARIYWNRARADGFFCGANEVWTYLPETLKCLIEEYRPKD